VGIVLRYENNEVPRAGDRIRNSKGGLGTVMATSPMREKHPEPSWMTVKWDEGIVEIEYDLASSFTLVSRTAEPSNSVGQKVANPEWH
jgi:hypothetical protein